MAGSPLTGRSRDDVDLQACMDVFAASLCAARRREGPYRHWLFTELLPRKTIQALAGLQLTADGPGRPNETRQSLTPELCERAPACRAVAQTFQAVTTVDLIEKITGTNISGAFLRLELVEQRDGFRAEPQSLAGGIAFRLLCYLGPSDAPDLGTDIYAADGSWSHRAPFWPGAGLAFTPAHDSWHGFEPRWIRDARRMIVVSYVSEGFVPKRFLAYPDQAVRDRRWPVRS